MKLFETQFGSQVYGTATPDSDIDIGIVFMETPLHIFGLNEPKTYAQITDGGHDIRKFWLKRFLRLCIAGNPNVLELIYTPESHIIECHPLFREHIIENAHLFLDLDNIIQSHLGFAKSQIIKMQRHEQKMGAKRKRLVELYGYDTKYASHAIRLIYQLTQFLEHGKISFPYPDHIRSILLNIKQGKVSLNEFNELYFTTSTNVDQLILGSRDIIQQFKSNNHIIASILETVYRSGWEDIKRPRLWI